MCLFPPFFGLSCFQKDAMEDSVEIVIEKLLHVTKDIVPKVIYFPQTCPLRIFLLLFHISIRLSCLGFKRSWSLLEHRVVSVWSIQMFKCMWFSLECLTCFPYLRKIFWHFHLWFQVIKSTDVVKWLGLQVIVPLLVTEDEKTLVICINCLTKVFILNLKWS